MKCEDYQYKIIIKKNLYHSIAQANSSIKYAINFSIATRYLVIESVAREIIYNFGSTLLPGLIYYDILTDTLFMIHLIQLQHILNICNYKLNNTITLYPFMPLYSYLPVLEN